MSLVDNFVNNIEIFVESYGKSHPEVANIEQLVAINRNDMDTEITSNPARFAWVAAVAEQAKKDELKKKREYDKVEALTKQAIRSGAIPLLAGISKLTEGVVDEMTESDEALSAMYDAYLDAKYKAAVVGKFVDSLGQKSDMLRTFSSNLRKEQESDFSVMKEKAKAIMGGDKS